MARRGSSGFSLALRGGRGDGSPVRGQAVRVGRALDAREPLRDAEARGCVGAACVAWRGLVCGWAAWHVMGEVVQLVCGFCGVHLFA